MQPHDVSQISNPASASTGSVSRSPVAGLITIAVLAMGGEGGGVLADWIVDLAEHSGYFAQSTSVPGVAQRTGATIYYLEIFPRSAAPAAHEPVLALMPVPGEVDVVVASELMEAGRAIQRGFVTPDRTTLITSTHRVYSMTERIAMADGRADSSVFEAAAQESAKHVIHADFAKLAGRAGAVISASLFGGLAGSGVLPFSRSQFEEAIRRGGIGIDASLRAFALGFDVAVKGTETAAEASGFDKSVGPALLSLAGEIEAQWPAPTHEILYPAIRRLAEYQDATYPGEFLVRLAPVLKIDHMFGNRSFTLTRETARYLALWSTYEDAARVADLKIRSKRFERVQRDTNPQPAQLVEIHEFLSPQPQEIADLLPAGLGEQLMRSEWLKRLITRFTGNGKVIGSSSISGFLLLYLLAKLRRLRRISLRYRVEHAAIARWLKMLCDVAPVDYSLGVELAECGQLIKGYADTHALGSRNFASILELVPLIATRDNAAATLKKLRTAALSDDTGAKLQELAKIVRDGN